MAERGKFLLYAVLATLAFAELLRSSSAVPVTRTGNMHLRHIFLLEPLVHEHTVKPSSQYLDLEPQVAGEGRLDIEINDYPGSGANNRHNPRPQLGRGCIDC
ncbi:hypothetical protein SAY86_006237 [Trapa natans]|uniref:Uncharacterized protein n=1 Tax=Trapa natans TaxID=22666 RepID=A0AAN7L6Y2_TRANT|nr:hypothetical protein SAY86_006237 [Trapa natans]